MIIYKATNLINGKVYIGQTVNTLDIRISEHISRARQGGKYYFHNAISKYGAENFKWEALRICDSIKSLNVFEQYYILYYNSMNSGYNLTSGGDNYIRSERTKKLMKLAQQNRSKETRKKMSMSKMGEKNPMFGKHPSKETLEKLSIFHKNWYKENPEFNKGKNNPNYGKKRSDEWKEMMSRIHKGKIISEKNKEILRKLRLGKKHTEETKKKISIGNKGKILSEETKKKMSEARIRYFKKIKEENRKNND